MEAEGYKGLYPVQATLSPARAAYLVKEGSRDGFRRAVQEASTRWGGATEPILTIAGDEDPEDWIKQILELTPIDGLVNVDLAESDAIRASEVLGLPWVHLHAIDRWGPVHLNTHPLSVPPGLGENLGPCLTAAPNSRLWEATVAGLLPSEHLDVAHRSGVNVLSTPTPDGIGRAQLRTTTWLAQTLNAFGETYASPAPTNMPTVIWLTSGDAFEDARDFWNVRALRPTGFTSMPMYLLPAEDVPAWTEFRAQLESVLGRPDEIAPDVFITSLSTPREQLIEIAESLGLVPAGDEETRMQIIWSPTLERRQAPFTYRIADGVRGLVAYRRQYGIATQLDAHVFTGRPTTLVFPSPIAFVNGGGVKLRLRSSVFDGLPKRDAVSSSMASGAVWNDGELELGVQALSRYRLEIQIPELPDALAMLLDDPAVGHSPSDKGSIAALFLERGESASALLEPDVFEAIRGLTTRRSKQFLAELKRITELNAVSDELNEFALTWASQSKRAYRRPENIGLQADLAAIALERLCGLRWAERGFEVRCSACRTSSFIELAAVPSGGAVCPACGSHERYTGANSAPSVFYRLDALIDRASDQGVFPHLLTIAALERREPTSWFLPGVDFTFGGNDRREADIIGLYAGRLAVGEVKTSGAQFTPEQIERDIDLAVRLGADVYIAAAPDVIPPESESIAKGRSSDANVDLILLDRSSLRP